MIMVFEYTMISKQDAHNLYESWVASFLPGLESIHVETMSQLSRKIFNLMRCVCVWKQEQFFLIKLIDFWISSIHQFPIKFFLFLFFILFLQHPSLLAFQLCSQRDTNINNFIWKMKINFIEFFERLSKGCSQVESNTIDRSLTCVYWKSSSV
jgi:hypothetical protein